MRSHELERNIESRLSDHTRSEIGFLRFIKLVSICVFPIHQKRSKPLGYDLIALNKSICAYVMLIVILDINIETNCISRYAGIICITRIDDAVDNAHALIC